MNNYDSNKLKAYEIKVLDKFVSICEKNKLKYFLAYGTLLGAVRHKGFIPWDDDIDVYMEPEDYYKFKDIMRNNPEPGYFYQSLETEKKYSLTFSKLRMDGTLVVEKKLKDEKVHSGIFIDIFPLLPFPNDERLQKKFFTNMKLINLLVEADLKDKTKYNNYGKGGKFLSKLFKFIPRCIRSIIASYMLKRILLPQFNYDKYICAFDHKTIDKSLFSKSTNILFEGKKYRAPKNYDKYLTTTYGNYMVLPPVDKRYGHSFELVDFDYNKTNEKIDFVILWVDGNDPKWQKEKNKYDTSKKSSGVNGIVRYRDWDNLKYWFRGVEKFAPWVNNIYFITWGHLPEWLDTSHPKLKIINHKDYIPEEYLPVFSSNPIILNIHRIKGLSDKFVFFNDDMFFINDVKQNDFFINGIPCDNYNEVNWDSNDEESTFSGMLKNNYNTLNKYFNKRKVIIRNLFKYVNYKYGLRRNLQTIKTTITHSNFVGIYNNHIPQPFLKSYFNKVWDLEGEKLLETTSRRFRSKEDLTEYLIRYFQLLDGNFIPRDYKLGKYFSVKDDNMELINYIENQSGCCICINDSDKNFDFEKCKNEINNAFDKILNEKSKFEK